MLSNRIWVLSNRVWVLSEGMWYSWETECFPVGNTVSPNATHFVSLGETKCFFKGNRAAFDS